MGKFIVGDIVAVPFPFSDLSGDKLRPALVLAELERNDLILCQITSKSFTSKRAIVLSSSDFSEGGLSLQSYIRPDKLFTAESTIIKKRKGKLKSQSLRGVIEKVQELFSLE